MTALAWFCATLPITLFVVGFTVAMAMDIGWPATVAVWVAFLGVIGLVAAFVWGFLYLNGGAS